MVRGKGSQSKHDAEIQKIAKELQFKGFDVKADISGFSKPETIRGYLPDVIAQKGKQKKVVEIETPDSVSSSRDVKQQQAFRQAAKQDPNTTFRRKVTD